MAVEGGLFFAAPDAVLASGLISQLNFVLSAEMSLCQHSF